MVDNNNNNNNNNDNNNANLSILPLRSETRYIPSIAAGDLNFDNNNNAPLEEELGQDSKALIMSLLKQVNIIYLYISSVVCLFVSYLTFWYLTATIGSHWNGFE